MKPTKLMLLLILLCVIGVLIAVAVFVFQLNLQSSPEKDFSFSLLWGFIKGNPMYSLSIISPIIVVTGVLIKLLRMDDERFASFF
jgi:uncharacterized membrane protein YhaH (DUF805 family)